MNNELKVKEIIFELFKKRNFNKNRVDEEIKCGCKIGFKHTVYYKEKEYMMYWIEPDLHRIVIIKDDLKLKEILELNHKEGFNLIKNWNILSNKKIDIIQSIYQTKEELIDYWEEDEYFIKENILNQDNHIMALSEFVDNDVMALSELVDNDIMALSELVDILHHSLPHLNHYSKLIHPLPKVIIRLKALGYD